jgi:hypothetical protein
LSRYVAITANRKSSVCVENMATAGRFALAQRNLENHVLTDIL